MSMVVIRRPRKQQQKLKKFLLRLEALEDRSLLTTLDPLSVPQFVNQLPNPLDPTFIYRTTVTTQVTLENGTMATVPLYHVGVYQIQQDLGLGLKDTRGNPIKTTVWGYGTSAATATYPGRSFVVQKDQAIGVQWNNGLVDAFGNPLPHLLPVDKTLLDAGYLASLGPTDQNLNSIGVPIVTHLHEGHTQAAYDGTPMQWFTPTARGTFYHGADFAGQTFTYDNNQLGATLWYHDHAMGVTRLNVYAGLAGFYILHDTNENRLIANHSLPDERYDIPLAIQDRMFTTDGQLYYPAEVEEDTTAAYPSIHPEFFGDMILVNGKAWPVLHVEPRLYRFRILDGSNSRFYNLRFDTVQGSYQTFNQVGTEGGLLRTPVPLSQLLVAPGERADIVVDFSRLAGKTITLTNDAKGPFPKGTPADPHTTGKIMQFVVDLPKNSSIPDAVLPATLNTIPTLISQNSRDMALFETTDSFGRLIQFLGTPTGGQTPFLDSLDPADTVQLLRNADGTQSVTETWHVYNNTGDTHPIHLHQVTFQIVSRQGFNAKVDPITGIMTNIKLTGQPSGPDANEAGWKDTVRMNPGTVTTIIAKFDLPGKYVWHCHILEHEEHDMMHFLNVVAASPAPAAPAKAITPAATTSPDAITAALETGHATVWPRPTPPAARLEQQLALFEDFSAPNPLHPRQKAQPGRDTLDGLFAEWGQYAAGAALPDGVDRSNEAHEIFGPEGMA